VIIKNILFSKIYMIYSMSTTGTIFLFHIKVIIKNTIKKKRKRVDIDEG
jgi:hypothetical protein